uniref:Uncharacterized protein n=1 Tax=Homalodisca liturata TaxID=320908 RepID=A0A1B6J307_9HEMI
MRWIRQNIFDLLVIQLIVKTLCDDIPVPRVYDKAHMHALAVRIRSKILQPFGFGTDLFSDMRSYIIELEDLKKGVNEENPEAQNAFTRLLNQGGPQHLLLRPVDTRPLAEFYKWDKHTVDMFQDMMEQTLHQWNDLRMISGLADNTGTNSEEDPSDNSNF